MIDLVFYFVTSLVFYLGYEYRISKLEKSHREVVLLSYRAGYIGGYSDSSKGKASDPEASSGLIFRYLTGDK